MTSRADYWKVAERVCTELELQALRLRDTSNLSPRAIAIALGTSRWAIRDRLDNADRKIAADLDDTPKEPA